MGRRLELDSYLSPCTKIDSRWTKGLNVSPESLKLLQENRETLQDIGTGKAFLNNTLIA
jgi:hypothetical protein